MKIIFKSRKKKEKKKTTKNKQKERAIFINKLAPSFLSARATHTKCVGRGTRSPQHWWTRQYKLSVNGARTRYRWAAQIPRYSAWLRLNYLHILQTPGGGVSVLLQFLHPAATTEISIAPAPQPLGHCWWSSAKQRPLSSASTFLCCSQKTIHYPACRFSNASFQQPDISFAPGI